MCMRLTPWMHECLHDRGLPHNHQSACPSCTGPRGENGSTRQPAFHGGQTLELLRAQPSKLGLPARLRRARNRQAAGPGAGMGGVRDRVGCQPPHQMYMAPRFSLSVASPMSRCAWPSAFSGSDGMLFTPSSVPVSRPAARRPAQAPEGFPSVPGFFCCTEETPCFTPYRP